MWNSVSLVFSFRNRVRACFTQNYRNEAVLASRPTTIVQTCSLVDRLAFISSRSQQTALAWQKTRHSERIPQVVHGCRTAEPADNHGASAIFCTCLVSIN